MQIRYLSIILVCLSINFQAAELKPKLKRISEAEYEGLQTPNACLLHATLTDNIEELAVALARGTTPHICYGADRNSALLLATQHTTQRPIVEWLLKFNADINGRNAKGQTALMAASAKGKDSIIQCLLDNKADPSLVDNNNNTALSNAVYFRNLPALKYFMLDVDLNRTYGKMSNTALIIASIRGYADVVSVLLSRSANPFIEDINRKNALDHAREAIPRTEEERLRFKQTVKMLEDYTNYSREIHSAAVGPLERIVASYLIYKDN